MPGVEGFLESTLIGSGWLLPALRASLRRAQVGGFETEGGTAAFRLTVGALEACPAMLAFSASAGVRPCVFGELGALRGAGSDTIEPRTVRKTWAALGTAVRLELVVARPLVLDSRLGLAAPLRRGRFLFVPEVFHEVAPVCVQASIGVAGRFP
jgi:hypothetical protein